MTEYEFNNLMSSRQISDDEATIPVHDETNSDNGEASEYTNTETHPPIGEEFDEAAIASNNEKIKHPDFLPNAIKWSYSGNRYFFKSANWSNYRKSNRSTGLENRLRKWIYPQV
ncbi:hypothetical protein NST77_17390 [Niallia sp. FSL W8-0177]